MIANSATLRAALSCAACVCVLLGTAAFAQQDAPKRAGNARVQAGVGAQDPFALRAARNRTTRGRVNTQADATQTDPDSNADANAPQPSSKPTRPAYATFDDRLFLQGESDAVSCAVLSLSCKTGAVVQTPSGEQTFALKQIASVELSVSKEFESALDAYESGKKLGAAAEYERALELFRNARQNAQRTIEKEWATAKIVDASLALGRDDDAVAEFFLLTRLDPFTPFLPSIPLRWVNQSSLERGSAAEVKQLTESTAAQWLEQNANKNPTAKLLAASVLLNSSQYGKAAVAALQDLVVLEPDQNASEDEQNAVKLFSLLATAQLWRTALLKNPNERDVLRWEKTLSLFPSAFRDGPEIVAAQARKKLGQNEQAANTFLRLAVLNADRYAFARFAEKEAADAYEKIGRKTDAKKLREDAAKRFGVQK